MTQLTDDEKRQIVRRFRKLKTAINDNTADLQERYGAFQHAYRGDTRKYVDEFAHVTDRRRWAAQLEVYLLHEIEAPFWGSTPNDEQQEAGREWIDARVGEIAIKEGVTIDEIEFADNPHALGEILIVRSQRARITMDVASVTLEDVSLHAGTQAEVDGRLRKLVSRIPRIGDRVVFERADGLFDVENIVASTDRERPAREGLKTLEQAREIARGHAPRGARVWYRRHDRPNMYEPH